MLLPSSVLLQEIENSEIDYMNDRMAAIRDRDGNPEGIEVQRFGQAICYYSKTMPWGTFNTVKGLTSDDIDYIEPIADFYRQRERRLRLEIIPSRVDQRFLKRLAELGLYQAEHHCSLIIEPERASDLSKEIAVRQIAEDQFDMYATIHCRGTGLPDDGIPYVSSNNRVLHGRPGWKFFAAYWHDIPAAVGVVYIHNRMASLTFAATLPEFRNRGLHQALLKQRISEASAAECGLAVGQCAFLSQSHRNMEQVGMKLGYIRTAWTEML